MRRKIKKQLAVLLILVMAVFCFTGCIRYRTTMTVKGNGTTDVSFLFAFEADGFSEIADNLNEITSEFEKDGWVIEPYSEDNYIGYIVTLRDVKLTDLEEKLNNSNPMSELGLGGFHLTIDGSYYTIHEESRQYLYNRSSEMPHVITHEDPAYRIFVIEHGFTWGGDWESVVDYQHFEKMVQ